MDEQDVVEHHATPAAGAGLVKLAVGGTGLLVGSSAAAAALPGTFGVVHAALSGVLFLAGSGAFLWAYALGISRSRVDLVTLSGLFFLAGDAAPAVTRRRLRCALVVEVVAVLIAAFARPYTQVAYGVLAPMFAMGLMAAWGGRYGSFPPRPPGPGRGANGPGEPGATAIEGSAS